MQYAGRECSMQVCVSTGYLGHPSCECSLSLALSCRECSMLSLVGAAISTIFVVTKVLLQQTRVCCSKTSFVMITVCLS